MAEPTPYDASPTLDQPPTVPHVTEVSGVPGATCSGVPGYELLGELGRGGMGVVYRARQVGLNRIVALKMVLHADHAGESVRVRFRAEAEAVARLRHPNVVQIYDVGEIDSRPFFSMEYVEGGSLAEEVRGKTLPPREAAELVRTLALAVEAAHRAGIVHRDLKPANVLMTADGTPKVTDFGLAKQLDTQSGQTQSGTVLGTPSYMAPEQAAGKSKEIGPAADVYSLGAILYELLTGRPPFQGETTTETLLRVLDSEPQRPRTFNRHIDTALEAVCLKCLEKVPQDRYPSAAALADDLEAYLKGETVLADHSSHLRVMRLLWRESRHAEVLAQHGRVWMCQAVVLFIVMVVADWLWRSGVTAAWPYMLTATSIVVGQLVPVWYFRLRGGKPLIPLERQMGIVTIITMCGFGLTVAINFLKGMKPLELLPLALVEAGMCMGCLGVLLGGSFYIGALACGMGALLLAVHPALGPVVFGVALGLGLFVPGWRFSRHLK